MWSSCIPVVATWKRAAFAAELNLTFLGERFLSVSNSKLQFTVLVKESVCWDRVIWQGSFIDCFHWVGFFFFLIVLSASLNGFEEAWSGIFLKWVKQNFSEWSVSIKYKNFRRAKEFVPTCSYWHHIILIHLSPLFGWVHCFLICNYQDWWLSCFIYKDMPLATDWIFTGSLLSWSKLLWQRVCSSFIVYISCCCPLWGIWTDLFLFRGNYTGNLLVVLNQLHHWSFF